MQAENAKHAAEMLKRSGELAGTAAEMLEGGAVGEAVTQLLEQAKNRREAEVEAILNACDKSTKIGVQLGTTGQYYTEGDEDWGFVGFPVTCTGYKSGSLAVQDMLNGNISYVIIDQDPANYIAKAINGGK